MTASSLFHRVTTAGGREGPHVVIAAGVHGDEFEPMSAARRLSEGLEGKVVRGRVTVVPVANVSAYRLGRRAGEDGLDLARTFPGRPDGSVTERVAHELSALIREADVFVDLHTGGLRLSVVPLAGYVLHPDPAVLEVQRQLAGAFGLPVVWGTDPSLDGRSLSVARDAGVPAIYAEYLGGGGFARTACEALVRGCRNVLAVLGVIGGGPAAPPWSPLVIEDGRPNSGFMQLQHPAPVGGFFEPSVSLGGRVSLGDPLGTIHDPLGGDSVVVPAGRSGVVLVLRVFPPVEPGESLGVVAEADGGVPTWSSGPEGGDWDLARRVGL